MAGSNKRILNELTQCNNDPPAGTKIQLPDEANVFLWEVIMDGPAESPYAGGHFKIEINLPKDYPFKPPVFTFKTKIYHPNVSNDGKGAICLAILRPESWKPPNRLKEVLGQIHQLLREPNPDDAVEASIAGEYKNDRKSYVKTAQEWTSNPPKVPTPEPHLPLRKASAERLRTRQNTPNPLFMHPREDVRGFGPLTPNYMDSTTATERSSLVTGNSSTSEFVKVYPAWPMTQENPEEKEQSDDDFDVDDAIGLYADGFDTPAKRSMDTRRSVDTRRSFGAISKRSLDMSREGDSNFLRPGSSPLRGRGSIINHRRSQSAGLLEKLKASEDLFAELPKPNRGHVRTSTQIIAGRDMSPGPSPAPAFGTASTEPRAGAFPIDLIPRDRYGFKKVSHYVTLQQYNAWEKSYNEHLERRKVKWLALMKQYGLMTDRPIRFPPKNDKVKRYVRKGIPPEWRGNAWFWYAGGPSRLAKNPGLYRKLIEQVVHGNKLSDNDREHIERDLNRTFPDNIRFKPDPTAFQDSHSDAGGGIVQPDTETSIVKALRRVLQAFAVHNPNIGYCQSLNFIAGLLLLFLDEDEEKAFILLNVVTTEHLPGTHGVALEGANIDIAVLMSAIKENLPTIWAKLDDKQTTPGIPGAPARLPTVSLATTAWFMSLFVGTLPIECVLRVWDCLFLEGSKTLFRVALAIFKAGEAQIKAVNDPMEIFQVVQSMPRGMIDANALMETCFRRRNGFGNLNQETVEKKREERRSAAREGRVMTMDAAGSGVGEKKMGMLARATSKARLRSKSVKKSR
ncbi:hypothetical protein M8818_007757 [Zalaria obscura]|uniref:Uncharacterized protein n=1 Tax=Zalaria obscura TaxID=2024903 RepID=A0ACC3S366_9PEZI